jgi:signal transduction histidine kinase
VIRLSLSRVIPAADGKHVALDAQLPEHALRCRTDPHRVEQILINVLVNAIRHTPDGSTVTVRLVSTPPDVEFHIEDQGPGVSPDDEERIFDVYQTKAGEEGKGSGLGLPLSRRLARLLGGELFVVADARPGGRFVLRLPAVET